MRQLARVTGATYLVPAAARVSFARVRVSDGDVIGQAGLEDVPAYYVHMGPAKAAGPAPVDLTPPAVNRADRAALHTTLAALRRG